MLENVEAVEKLGRVAQARGKKYISERVKLTLLEEALSHGWSYEKKNEKTAALRKEKPQEDIIQDRIWTLLYKMDFAYINNQESALLLPEAKTPLKVPIAIDVVGIDREVGVAILCKVSEERREIDAQFREELLQYAFARSQFSMAINQPLFKNAEQMVNRRPALAVFAYNMIISDADKKYASEQSIALFDENDLEYYEKLVAHLGAAAKYQFFADLLPGKEVPGLEIIVPAIRLKMGKYFCYSFVISPERLLKIAWVAHRTRGKKTDLYAYQRMIDKERLESIKKYINEIGIFPTNIVISLNEKPFFQRGKQDPKEKQMTEQKNGIFGWLELKKVYRSAWVIDGQHRLYAYSGHPRSADAFLSVLAFEDLPPNMQARLFIDINSEQKRVNPSLLQELYSEVHKDTPAPELRVGALITQAIQALNADGNSAFYRRILTSEGKRSTIRCISLNSLFQALDTDLLVNKKNGAIVYGPLWVENDDDATIERIVYILKDWFNIIRDNTFGWWDIGSGEGGGLAMNDSVVASIAVLKSVVQYFSGSGKNLYVMSNQELAELLRPYAATMSTYLGVLSKEERKIFREAGGAQGQWLRTRRCQFAIHQAFSEFMPPGLKEFIGKEVYLRATLLIENIQNILQKYVVDRLQDEFGSDEQQWWMEGISLNIRQEATQRYEEDKGKLGWKDHYLTLSDYSNIIQFNSEAFRDFLEDRVANNAVVKAIDRLSNVSEIQKKLLYDPSKKPITPEQLATLEMHKEWLGKHIRLVSGRNNLT